MQGGQGVFQVRRVAAQLGGAAAIVVVAPERRPKVFELTAQPGILAALQSLIESQSGGAQVLLGERGFPLPAKTLLPGTVILSVHGRERIRLPLELRQLVGAVARPVLLQARRRQRGGIFRFAVRDYRLDLHLSVFDKSSQLRIGRNQ